MTMDLLIHNDVIKFKRQAGVKAEFFKILSREVAKWESSTEFAALAHGADSSSISLTDLEPPEGELYFCMPKIKDGIQYRFRIPAGKDIWGVDKSTEIGFITWRDSPYHTPNPDYGFYIINESIPQVVARNETGFSTTPLLYFDLMKYVVEKITEKDEIDELERSKQFSTIEMGGLKAIS